MQQKVDDFIEDLKQGDLRAFRYISYDVLERSVLQIKEESLRYKTQLIEMIESGKSQLKEIPLSSRNGVPFMEYLVEYGKSNREKLVRCTLQGLFNLDPRVRLTAVHFLRKLRPDYSMQAKVKLAVGIDSDWIAYDRAKRDFVFTPPQRLETIASRWEYYREKDLNWPTDVLPGQWGLNDDLHPGLNDNNVVGDLSSARWGETNPEEGKEEYRHLNLGAGRPEVTTPGYTRMSDQDKAEYVQKIRQSQVYENGEWRAIRRNDEVPFLPEEGYRRYHTQEGVDGNVDLLSYQSDQVGNYVPMGQGPKYTYVNCDGYRVIANPYAETMKLDEFVTRVVWYNKVKQKQMNSLAIVSKDTFSTLWRSIDGELPQYIPFLSTATTIPMLDHTDVPVIINGLHKNKNLLNKWVMMRSLKDIYKMKNTPANVKEDINIALWEEKREINRRSYVHGLVLTKESIRVGKLDPVAEHQREVKALEVTARGTREVKRDELGFRVPNTEIRANGYRLIWAGKSEERDDAETKLSLRQLRNNRVYAYKDENNDIIDYYDNKDLFYALQRQYHGNADREVVNVNRLRKAQTLINALLSGNGDIWRTAIWPDVETSVLMTLYRVMVKFEKNAGNDAFMTTFMDQLRIQEAETIDEESVTGSFPDNSYSDMKRDNIIRAALGGLFNRDPRVRLQCAHFIRRLGPDETILNDVVRARSVMATESATAESPETDDYRSAFIDTNVYERKEDAMMSKELYRYQGIDQQVAGDTSAVYGPIWLSRENYTIPGYEYQKGMYSNLERQPDGSRVFIPFYGEYQLKAPSEELDKLYKYCLRDQLVNRIKKGDVTAITRMTRAEFSVLAEVIDDEYILEVPFASFHADPFAAGRQRITVFEIRGNNVTQNEIWNENTGLPDKYAIFDLKDISVIKKGIESTNFLVQKGTAEFLVRFYNEYAALTADVKREVQDALYFYKQDDIIVEEIVLAFEGQNPDGRAVIKVGTRLAEEMNPGGIRVYNSLPIGIRKDIRDAILDEQEQFPEALINILGVIGRRAPSVDERDRLEYQATSTGDREVIGRAPNQPNTGYTPDNVRVNQ
jgi:hypothetical protein